MTVYSDGLDIWHAAKNGGEGGAVPEKDVSRDYDCEEDWGLVLEVFRCICR